jgi:p-aminobenzoyl-glutamate transporter AbgT
MARTHKRKKRGFFHTHSLSLVTIALLVLWIVMYSVTDEHSRLGSFFGNAIADWSGSVVIILGTKFFTEEDSVLHCHVKRHLKHPFHHFLWAHSLLIFLIATGLVWAGVYMHMKPDSKWGEVVSNIVSEWVQMAGLVFFTKRLIEKGSHPNEA